MATTTPSMSDRTYADVVPFPKTEAPAAFDNYDVAGIRVSALSFEEGISHLLSAPIEKRRMRVHFAAMHTFVEASKDPELRELLNEAELIAPDGMPMVWLGRRQGKRVERFCGPDVMPAILDRSRAFGFSHFFYGGQPGAVEALVETLRTRFPGLNVAGVYTPPFRPLTPGEQGDIAQMINDSGADFVWVALGSPKQDRWLASFRPLLKASVLLAVGAAFDFENGRVKRAPRWAQRAGVEWLFRLASEPRRLFWRYTITGFQFGRLLLTGDQVGAAR